MDRQTVNVPPLRRLAVAASVLFGVFLPAGCVALGLDRCDLPVRPGDQQMCRAANRACDGRPTPDFSIDEMWIEPYTVHGGDSVIRRIVYTYCPSKTGQIAHGTLEASIYLDQREVISNRRVGFALMPGQHVYDAEIQVPRSAEPGIYMLVTRLDGISNASFKRPLVFKVVR